MSSKNRRLRVWALTLMGVALLLFVASHFLIRRKVDTDFAASRVAKVVSKRMAVLEDYARAALATPPGEWLSFPKLPQDMVIYRYYSDTLHSWVHQFPVQNDDIRTRTVVQRLGSLRGGIVSPLSEVSPKLSFVNYGPKWYIVKAFFENDCTIIAGLEVEDELGGSFNGVNRHFKLPDRYSVEPLSSSTGSTVSVGGEALFKVVSGSVATQGPDSLMFWIGILLFITGALILLVSWKTIPGFLTAASAMTALMMWAYFYGRTIRNISELFSPVLYADGPVLYSLGALLIINLWITLMVGAFALVGRSALLSTYRNTGNGRTLRILSGIACLTIAVLVCVHIHTSFKSIVMNSNICLELYKVDSLSRYTSLVYLSYFFLALTFPALASMAVPAVKTLTGLHYNVYSRGGRIFFCLAAAAYFVTASSVYGFRKEQNRVEVWTNRLAMDRDISLELQLRRIETAVAADPVIASVSVLENSNALLENRLKDTYMGKRAQDNDISVFILSGNQSKRIDDIFNERIRNGVQIADNSYFFYSRDQFGKARYSGFYSFYTQNGPSSLMICVESKANREDRGYLSLLGIAAPGRATVPVDYSYAKYVADKLVSYKGSYAYPTVIPDGFMDGLSDKPEKNLIEEGFVHFIHLVSSDEVVVVSRERTDLMDYVVEGILIAIAIFVLVSLVTKGRRRRVSGGNAYFKKRINAIILLTLILTLVAMATFSFFFLNRRNEMDMQSVMSTKISSLQSMLSGRARSAADWTFFLGQDVNASVENVGNTLKSDITLYTPSGRAFMTTTPEIFDRMIIGPRINEVALRRITEDNLRWFIQKENISSHSFYALYAPVFNSEGTMIAIASSPYTDTSYDIGREAFIHGASIVAVFFLLLIIAQFVITAIVNRLFRPLSEMSEKMGVADVGHLEYIIYEQDDEISGLVKAYNRMVHDLSDSTRQLAQAERDKAWSAMARQVAHEIKNPLTPIKLNLQMLIRMKQSGKPSWEQKFDEVAALVLQHIDMLADTANEFSTFAHLYSEEPVRIDLDNLLKQEIEMFLSRADMRFEYFGLEGAFVNAPKPQLIRVFVNIINNSIQAVEGMRKDAVERGLPPEDGCIRVSLRHSVKEGFYDIVFEDNGPGVKEEDRGRLFTPNFTTKSGGTGLGLAISRSIIDRCGGEILYSRSFSLGGACFTIRYPK